MDQLICASLSHTHYWYEVGMLKVPPYAVLILKKNLNASKLSISQTGGGNVKTVRWEHMLQRQNLFVATANVPT